MIRLLILKGTGGLVPVSFHKWHCLASWKFPAPHASVRITMCPILQRTDLYLEGPPEDSPLLEWIFCLRTLLCKSDLNLESIKSRTREHERESIIVPMSYLWSLHRHLWEYNVGLDGPLVYLTGLFLCFSVFLQETDHTYTELTCVGYNLMLLPYMTNLLHCAGFHWSQCRTLGTKTAGGVLLQNEIILICSALKDPTSLSL